MRELAGKLAVVTGAGSGIGRALGVELAKAGVRLVLADVDEAGLAEAVAEQGGADTVVNNAGMSSAGRVIDLTPATLERTMAVNFWGVVHGTQAFLPQLLGKREAALANVSSVYGLMGVPGQAAYCASKFAVRGFTEALRHEVRGTGLCVTAVYPGGVRTAIAARSRVDFPVGPEILAEAQREWEARPMCSPADAAAAIVAGIRARRPRVFIGSDARFIDRLVRWLPERHDGFVDRFLRRGAIWRALDASAPETVPE